jgi:RNA polymerase sigma-70 factor (ECF subfamily)
MDYQPARALQGCEIAVEDGTSREGVRSAAGEAGGPQRSEPLETPEPGGSRPADEGSPGLDSVELLTGAMQGDPAATARLFFALRPMIHRVCRARLRYGRVSAAVDDVTQEALLAIFTALPRYEIRQGVSFRAFALTITMRKIADAQRGAARDRIDLVAQPLDRPFPDENPPEQHALAVEQAARIRRLMQTLSPPQRAVLSLRIVIGLNANDTAHTLGMSATAVRVAQHRALRALRSRLTEDSG